MKEGGIGWMNLQEGYAVVDLETTGLDCWNDLIVEIGVCLARPGETPFVDSRLVKIGRPLPRQIVRLTGITDRDLIARGLSIDAALGWLVESTAGLPLVGYNILNFDRGFLLEAARRHRRAVEEGAAAERVIDEVDDLPAHRFIDAMALYRGYKLGRYPEAGESHREYAQRVLSWKVSGMRYSLAAACAEFGISTERVRAHRAAGDVIQTQRVFERLLILNPPG